MVKTRHLDVQYLVDGAGQRRSVLISIEQFQQLMEDIEDLAAIAERREDPRVSHEDVIAELRRDGLLD